MKKTTTLSLDFWGVRGSYPQSGPDFVRVGGHTSCVSLTHGEQMVVFDAGTGLVNLGQKIANTGLQSIDFLLSHFHLDHVFGIPFFLPIWNPSTKINFFSGVAKPFGGTYQSLKQIFSPPYFPVPWDDFPSHRHYTDFTIGDIVHAGGLDIQTIHLDHPGGGSGYRIEKNGKIIVYLSDTAHSPDIFSSFVPFTQDADVLIYDATFTCEEFAIHPDWGHSTWMKGIDLAKEANVKKLVLFHHDPSHTDEKMDEIKSAACVLFPNTVIATEGLRIDL